MLAYIIKRILFFIPTLFIISLVAFMISVNSPIDPVNNFVSEPEELGFQVKDFQSQRNLQDSRQRIREKFNLHLPVFYFRLASLAEPDTFYRIHDKQKRKTLGQLLDRTGNWSAVQGYYGQLATFYQGHGHAFAAIQELPYEERQAATDALSTSMSITSALLSTAKPEGITHRFYQLDTLYSNRQYLRLLHDELLKVRFSYEQLYTQKHLWKKYVPVIVWYGSNNQYHKWASAILTKLDFGRSYQSGQPISQRIGELFFWSFMFTLISVILAYLISLPLGILSAALHGSRFDKISTVIVFAFDSLPNFWVATLLLVTFANPDVFNWFPSSFNIIRTGDEGLIELFFQDINRLILPLIAYTYGQVAYMSRLMRSSMLEVIQQDYMRTARAKGLRERMVLLRHGFRNASLPIITRFAGVLPALLGGNVILETIFMIPGMGREVFEACFAQDIPMIMAVFTLTGFLAILGYLVSDLLYAWTDPRIKFHKQEGNQ